jgi:hypothetical protein
MNGRFSGEIMKHPLRLTKELRQHMSQAVSNALGDEGDTFFENDADHSL